jgi:hypothetical protein
MDNWAIGQLIDWACGPKTSKETKAELRRELFERAKEFAGSNPGPVEQVLAETAAVNWLALRFHETRYASASTSSDGLTIRQADLCLRHIDGAHRRLMSSLKTLATVRRLGLPVVQINVANQQVNQLNTGGPNEGDR